MIVSLSLKKEILIGGPPSFIALPNKNSSLSIQTIFSFLFVAESLSVHHHGLQLLLLNLPWQSCSSPWRAIEERRKQNQWSELQIWLHWSSGRAHFCSQTNYSKCPKTEHPKTRFTKKLDALKFGFQTTVTQPLR